MDDEITVCFKHDKENSGTRGLTLISVQKNLNRKTQPHDRWPPFLRPMKISEIPKRQQRWSLPACFINAYCV